MEAGSVGRADDEGGVAGRDEVAARCAAAERKVEELTAELAAAYERLRQAEEAPGSALTLFEGGTDSGLPGSGDGTDRRIIPIVLGATAVVSGMVVVLAVLNGNLFSVFGVFMALVTAGLAWGAAATRVEPVSVHLSRGVVYIEKGDSKYRFDLANEDTRVTQHGSPGDTNWHMTFARRHTGPFEVDASMVEPEKFAAQVRQHRPSV